MAYANELSEPVPLDRLLRRGVRGRDGLVVLGAHGAVAAVGLDEATVPLVAAAATEPGIVEFCPNDGTRFADVSAARRWAAKGRAFVGITVAGDRGARTLLAYGWSGPEHNDHVPGADVTTAYRVTAAGQALARRVRAVAHVEFRLGLVLGELVVATAVAVGGADPSAVSLETWASNRAARRVYADLGFVQPDGVAEVPAVRLTLQPVGAAVEGSVVHADPAGGGRRLVDDHRCFYVLRGW